MRSEQWARLRVRLVDDWWVALPDDSGAERVCRASEAACPGEVLGRLASSAYRGWDVAFGSRRQYGDDLRGHERCSVLWVRP